MNLDALAISELIKSTKEETSAPTRIISVVTFDMGDPITTAFQSAAFVIYIDGIAYLWNHKELPKPIPQREWQNLKDDEIFEIWSEPKKHWLELVKNIQNKLKEKNGG